MILTTIALGGAILGATTIAGLRMTYQIRQATDFRSSAKAIFAADTAVEWGLYQFFNSTTNLPGPTFSDSRTSFSLKCYASSSPDPISCKDPSIDTIRTVGIFGSVNRALELGL